MKEPSITITKYGDGSDAILVQIPGEAGAYPVELIGGAEVRHRYRAFPKLLEALLACRPDINRLEVCEANANDGSTADLRRLRRLLQQIDAAIVTAGGRP